MKEVDALTEHIKYYNQKIETSEKNLVKKRQKQESFKKQIKGMALTELDIYALDSL